MSGKGRGVMQLIWKNFTESLRLNAKKHKLIGEDFYGTKYYEVQVASNISRKKPSRYFVPVNKTDHEQEIPAEWESWLRNRRVDPPSAEEVENNHRLAMMKKQNAAEIEAKYSVTKRQTPVHIAKKGPESFPTYEEYKHNGQDDKINKPN